MAFKDKDRQREYKRLWLRKRRQEYLDGYVCFHCGTDEDLQIHHVDPADKEDHRIWGWSRQRLEAELEKCIVLCVDCHRKVHYELDDIKPVDSDQLRSNLALIL